jgi:hypothetical protein
MRVVVEVRGEELEALQGVAAQQCPEWGALMRMRFCERSAVM